MGAKTPDFIFNDGSGCFVVKMRHTPMIKLKPPPKIVYSAFLVVFLLFEVYLYINHPVPLARVETDGISYMDYAKNSTLAINPYHGPFYPIAIRGVETFTAGDWFSAAKIVSILGGFLFILASWLTIYKLNKGRFTLFENALFFILVIASPIILTNSVLILSDMLAAGLFYLMMATALFSGAKKSLILIAGIFGGLAYLTRYVYIFILALPVIYILFSLKARPMKYVLKNALFYYLGFFMITSPWLVYEFVQKGNPFWNLNYLNIAFNMYRNGQGWNVFPTESQFPGLFSVIASNPKLFVKSWLITFISLPNIFYNLAPYISLFGLVGLVTEFKKLNPGKILFYGAGVLYIITLCLIWIEDRFILILIPLAAYFIVAGISDSLGFLRKFIKTLDRPPVVLTAKFLLAALLVLISINPLKNIPNAFLDQAFEYQTAANWIIAHNPVTNDLQIVAAKPHIAFFSGAIDVNFRTLNLQNLALNDLPAVLNEIKPAYFIFDERYAATEFPQYKVLLDPDTNPFPDILTPVQIIESPQRLVIYQYNSP